MCVIKDNPDIKTSMKGFTSDIDAVSSYPSNTVAINLSKETTKREIIRIDGHSKEDFKINNINLIFGNTNAISYATNMLNFPTLSELNTLIE